jgi:hypothetical protein
LRFALILPPHLGLTLCTLPLLFAQGPDQIDPAARQLRVRELLALLAQAFPDQSGPIGLRYWHRSRTFQASTGARSICLLGSFWKSRHPGVGRGVLRDAAYKRNV